MRKALPYLVLIFALSYSTTVLAVSATSSAVIGPNGPVAKATAVAGNTKAISKAMITEEKIISKAIAETKEETVEVKKHYHPTKTKKITQKASKVKAVKQVSKNTENTTKNTEEVTKNSTSLSQAIPPVINQAMDNKSDSVVTEKTVKRFGGFLLSIVIFQAINTILLFVLLFRTYKNPTQRF